MIDFSFTEEQELFQDAVREWLARNLPLEKVRENDETQKLPRELLKGLGDLGLLLMTAPEEHGGAGADWVTTAIAAEELGYADISIALPVFFLVQAGWGFVVDRYCTDAVRDAVIRKAARGDAFIGIGVTEPGGGSDVAGFQTTLKRGDGCWIVNGEKTYISGTAECQELGGGYFSTGYSDRPKGHRGMTAFYLPLNAPGVEVTKRFDDLGRMAISTGGFKMTDVVVPDEHQIGETNRGFYLTMEGFDAARLLVAASCIGAAQRGLEIGMEYIKERRAFGQPLASYQGIQFDLADMAAHLEAVRALIYKTAWMQDQKYQKGTFTPLEVCNWISMCKYLAPHLAFDVFRRTLLWMGAYGYTKECPLEMGLRGVMSYCIGAEGATNIQKIVIARETLGRDWMR
ncbi:MAG: acyl-CoA/acyl-ACP dehydrogenase [Candidatus Bathyarchaeota archaeon]|nr:acyl-CoA/acyl-ACP dehydrogenase [Candidatus Bathyarchaeota archaeon]